MGVEEDRQARMRRTWRQKRGEQVTVPYTKTELEAAFAAVDALKPALVSNVGGAIQGAIPGITMQEAAYIFAAWLAEELV